MKILLEHYIRYFDFLYEDSRYRITDSRADGMNASLTVTGGNLTWLIAIDKGQLQLFISPTRLPENGFGVSLIRQYLYGLEDVQYLSANEEVRWARENIDQIEQLFSDVSALEATCSTLRALLRSNGEKQWGPPGQ